MFFMKISFLLIVAIKDLVYIFRIYFHKFGILFPEAFSMVSGYKNMMTNTQFEPA